MKHHRLLVGASLLSILLFEVHLADEISRGMEPGGRENLVGATLISLTWLCGTLLLGSRPLGYLIMLVGGLLATVVPYLHMQGAGIGPIATTRGGILFAWTLLSLGLAGTFSMILATRGLWRREWGPPTQSPRA